MKRTLLIIMLCWIFPGSIMAQDEKSLLVKMNETYLNASSFSMDALISIYENRSDPQPSTTYKGSMQKSGSMFYSNLMGHINLVNTSCSLVIDEEQQLMIYGNPWKQQSVEKPGIAAILDSTLFKSASVKLKSVDGEHKTLVLTGKQAFYDKIEVTINTHSNTMEEVTYFLDPKDDGAFYKKIQVKYSNTKINPNLPASGFSETPYITKRGNKIIPKGKWAGYKVIDQTDIKYPQYE